VGLSKEGFKTMSSSVTATPWRIVSSRATFKDQWISIRTDEVVNGCGVLIPDYHVLEYPDWVNVIPVLADGRVLLAREYRHGVGQVVLGLISGGLTVDDANEPEIAARRELLEETGHTADQLQLALTSFPNAASHNNRVFSFVAQGLSFRTAPVFEVGEAVELTAAKPKALMEAIQSGQVVMQAMHVAALYSAQCIGALKPLESTLKRVMEPSSQWPDALQISQSTAS